MRIGTMCQELLGFLNQEYSVDWSSVPGLLRVLEFRGLIATLFMTVSCVWIVSPGHLAGQFQETGKRVLFSALLLAGAAAFAPSIASVQVPLQRMVSTWVVSNVASADPLLISIPAIFMSGLVQESTKLLIAVLAFRILLSKKRPVSEDTAVGIGVYVGAGYGGFEAWLVLSHVLGAIVAPAPYIALSALERFIAVGFHVGAAGLVWYFWYRGGPITKLLSWLGGSLYHALLNYGIVLVQAGVFSITALYLFLMVGSGAALFYLRRKLVTAHAK